MQANRQRRFLDELNHGYELLHRAKEDAFWTAMMGLGDDPDASQGELDRREIEISRFLQDPSRPPRVRAELAEAEAAGPEGTELVELGGWLRTFEAHAIGSAEARALAEEIVADEGRLARARGEMGLGFEDPGRGFVRASSVRLGLMLSSEEDEGLRRAAWDGLRSIETFVLENGFLEVVEKRNELGRMLGAEDYYDWKVRRAEGMTKREIFALLDELEQSTREAGRRHVDALREREGAGRVTPWNLRYLTGGDVTRDEDPFFPFASAIERWARSFAALGIDYAGAELVLDLVDREGKHENGFMHGPVPAWRENGLWRPARIQFTANAIPGMVGSGVRATQTLFHEGGHAAHFANIDMPSPCFSQEFAPTSVAFAETQSMFLDSLLEDADWCRRYALDRDGRSIPEELVERSVRVRQSVAAWNERAMLAICYGERAIYELPRRERTAERVLEVLREIERKILFLDEGAARPVLSVPHLLSGDASAYYHGYVLADMGVHQTRAFFLERDGHLMDNPRIGPDLRETYWKPGNSKGFRQLVAELSGRPLSADPLAAHLSRTPEDAVAEARRTREREREIPPFTGAIDLGARIRIAHGNETVAVLDGRGFDAFVADFASWIEGLATP